MIRDPSQSRLLSPFPHTITDDRKEFHRLIKVKNTDVRPKTRNGAESALWQAMFFQYVQWLNFSIEKIFHSDKSAMLYDQMQNRMIDTEQPRDGLTCLLQPCGSQFDFWAVKCVSAWEIQKHQVRIQKRSVVKMQELEQNRNLTLRKLVEMEQPGRANV